MNDEHENRDEVFEVGAGGRYVRLMTKNLVPVILVGGLVITGVVMLRHIFTMHDDMADLETSVINKVNTEAHFRQAEHSDLLSKLDRLFADQTQTIMGELTAAQLNDGKSHGTIERAIARSCRAKDKDFAKAVQPYVSYEPVIVY